MIEAESLGKTYDRKEILRGISLSVRDGEILGLIGPSGSGKSTLLRLLDLLETPTTGRLTIFGEDALEPGSRFRLRRQMAMLNQKPVIFNRSVSDNIAIGLRYRGVSTGETRRRVASMLDEIGLSGYGSRAARTLSGGEAQRVALARAVVTDPEILFLDEPTANLDPVSVEKIEEIVLRLNRESSITTVISTHDMLQGQRLAKRIGVIMGGSLQQTGTTREIFHQPATKDIAQFVRVENIYPGTILSNRGGEVEVEVAGRKIFAITNLLPGKRANVLFRAEDVTLHIGEDTKSSARYVFSGRISRLVPSGP
ncbi:MAG: phosphate ABC transporter ATP-binding protein, partial [Methanoregulaceae archaeon]|nr:phosphate ABC transporter ATP-binding protein [Methanoregulaceae archaeon]